MFKPAQSQTLLLSQQQAPLSRWLPSATPQEIIHQQMLIEFVELYLNSRDARQKMLPSHRPMTQPALDLILMLFTTFILLKFKTSPNGNKPGLIKQREEALSFAN